LEANCGTQAAIAFLNAEITQNATPPDLPVDVEPPGKSGSGADEGVSGFVAKYPSASGAVWSIAVELFESLPIKLRREIAFENPD
jgi:hypothetical protein